MKELLLRTLTGITLIVLFIGSILLGPTTTLIILLLVYGLGTRELYHLRSVPLSLPATLVAVSGGLLIFGVYAFFNLAVSPLWFIAPGSLWLAAYSMMTRRDPGLLVFFWIALPLALFLSLGWFPEGSWSTQVPIAILAMIWVNDTFAYVSGKLLGKHPMTPKLSPGKTWEGFAGGLFFSIVAALLFNHFSSLQAPVIWIAAGCITSLFSLTGDLFESRLKRKYKVKDTGEILPGHGGILDRFDSLLFVAPALFLLILLIHLFT